MTGTILYEQHMADLRSSGLSLETIKVSGFRSVCGEDANQALGRKDLRGNAMEIPYFTHNGNPPSCRYKPDNPPLDKKGRPCKYLTAKGAGNQAYFPPNLPDRSLTDTSRGLLITEGEKKALKATQEGFPCLGLAGVWCFRSKDQHGRSRPIADLDYIEWQDRKVWIVFDSDLADKPEVQRAEAALAEELQRRGALVHLVRLPDGRQGEKVGLDDFLIQHGEGGPAELRKLLKEAESIQGDSTSAHETYPYAIQDGRLGWMKSVGRGDDATEIFVPLCNFVARVVEDRALDNGVEHTRSFIVDLEFSDGRRLRIEVSAAQFASMGWVMREAGVRARITAGYGAQDKLREAIQVHSTDVREIYAYAHTGWREVDGRKVFLHAGRTDVQVALEAPLNRYALPEHPEDVDDALRGSLALLKTASDEVTIPLLAVMFLAPLCEILRPDFVLFLVGKTGSLKSTLAALFLSHYGHFPDKTALPASWESTDNALERRLSMLKDVPCVVDDYAPSADAYTQRRQAQRAQRIIRGMGNLSGRSRLKADLSERLAYVPRGLLISTGEDLPPGQSILARSLSIEVERDRLNMEAITEAQRQAAHLPHAMAAYIEWLAPQLGELAKLLPEQWRQHRTHFAQQAAHMRIPEILAHLAVGIDLLTSFARDRGVLSEDEIRDLSQRTRQVLLALGKRHGQRVREEDPAEVFLSTLTAMLAQGTAQLASREGTEEPVGMIGWKDTRHALLIPEAARQVVARFLREGGGHFPHSARALNEALEARGALEKGADGKGPRLVKIRGKGRRVMQIPLHMLEPDEPVENNDGDQG